MAYVRSIAKMHIIMLAPIVDYFKNGGVHIECAAHWCIKKLFQIIKYKIKKSYSV